LLRGFGSNIDRVRPLYAAEELILYHMLEARLATAQVSLLVGHSGLPAQSADRPICDPYRVNFAANQGAMEPSRSAPPRGLYDGFEGYRTPTTEDYRRVLGAGMVVPDANVLLNLYRYTDQARDDLLSVLARLGNQLWIPHQVLVEFWRNRDAVLRDPRDTERIAGEMSDTREQVLSAFRGWANRVSLPPEQATELVGALSHGFDAVIDGVERFSDASAIESARDTDKDAVLRTLEPILAGRVGSRFDDETLRRVIEEGLRRVSEREPPGYMDKNKDDSAAAGDYLVWEQVLIEAEQRKCDVVFVTADVKEDWWRKEAGELRGPRLELVTEMRRRGGSRLLMLRPTRLLELAREVLKVTVHDESVQDADRVDRLLSDDEAIPPDGGWDAAAIEALFRQLNEEGAVQEAVIRYAALQGGFIEREKVYEIAEYDEFRQLKGFTRPVNRITKLLRDEGRIDEAAVDLLTAVYNPLSDNPSVAVGFEVNRHVLPLVVAAVRRRPI
jgi:hypothetical protein